MSTTPSLPDEAAEASEWAQAYRGLNLQVVPAHLPSEHPQNWKRPALTGWRDFELTAASDDQFSQWYGQSGQFNSRLNMGLITGLASAGVFCVDLDLKDGSIADEWWAGALAVHNNNMPIETPTQRTGGGGRQILFRAPHGWSAPTFSTKVGIDIRGAGGFMMCPPSLHESGNRYEWLEGLSPWDCSIEIAPEWLMEEIEAVREKHGGGSNGPRERVKPEGLTDSFGKDLDGREDKMKALVWGVMVDLRRAHPSGEEPFPADIESELNRAWEHYLSTTATRLPPRPGHTTADLLEIEGRGRSEFLRKWRYALKQWNGKLKVAAFADPDRAANDTSSVSTAESTTSETPAALVLFDPWESYAVPTFPMMTLPPWMQRWAKYQATSVGVDPSAAAMAALTTISGALDQRITLKMKRTGNWYVRPRLWCVLVGDPSAKKTPIISAAVSPLRSIEGVGVKLYQRELAKWKDLPKEDRGPEPDKPTRYIFNDITVEKVGEVLSRQDRGALVEHDELSGWIGAMDKYSGGKGASADRAFWLSAYNGGPKTIDRLGRGEVYVENLCVSFLADIQPDRLATLTGLTSDGLLQRFIPVMMRKPDFSREVADDTPAGEYSDLVKYIPSPTPWTRARGWPAKPSKSRCMTWST